ncbi:hypothetical protein OUZ56_007175 [Daphnia magna]|uniref:Uncharacterized protein n=1 Tax=Daphnia magna TaxID=35525 RepID=A0ABQ9YXY5_9CRUS|nr:hypothetical protein OUZ56_007175 [Daphnia magna]
MLPFTTCFLGGSGERKFIVLTDMAVTVSTDNQLALSSRQADAPQQLCVPRIKEIFMGKFLRFSSNSIFGIENHWKEESNDRDEHV